MHGILLTGQSVIFTIPELVGSLGFPIVMCGALFWKMHEQDKRHAEQIESVTQAINNNTVVLTHLIEKIEGGTQNV